MDARRTAILGMGIAAFGLLCVAGGIALLVWRILKPDEAVIIPPGMVFESTPTPGYWGSPVSPPPLPDDLVVVAILPVSEQIVAAATWTVVPTATATQTATNTATHQPTTTPRSTRVATLTLTPSPLPSETLTPTSTSTPTFTPSPTSAPAMPDRILIDSIGLNAPIVPVGQHSIKIDEQVYSQWDVPETFAAGWHQTSAPLGQPGNTVINGHHNRSGEVFRYLVNVEPGDLITIVSQGQRYRYQVAQTMVLPEEGQPLDIRKSNARWILPTDDERVTLITCWPYMGNSHRLIVIALPVYRPAEIP
jgi:sortase A